MGRSKIVVRSLRASEKESSRRCTRTEFHVLDLERDVIERCCFPSMFHYNTSLGTMITTGSSVYVLGGITFPYGFDTDEFFRGGARLDAGMPPLGWAHVPPPTVERSMPRCAALKGKIYVFGYDRLLAPPEVYDPALLRNWRITSPLPPRLFGCHFSAYVLSDPTNNRLLLHLYGAALDSSPSLYAFYPDPARNGTNNVWKCIAPGFRPWYHIAAVADNVIYFHDRKNYRSSVLGAYDLKTGIRLDVKWT